MYNTQLEIITIIKMVVNISKGTKKCLFPKENKHFHKLSFVFAFAEYDKTLGQVIKPCKNDHSG